MGYREESLQVAKEYEKQLRELLRRGVGGLDAPRSGVWKIVGSGRSRVRGAEDVSQELQEWGEEVKMWGRAVLGQAWVRGVRLGREMAGVLGLPFMVPVPDSLTQRQEEWDSAVGEYVWGLMWLLESGGKGAVLEAMASPGRLGKVLAAAVPWVMMWAFVGSFPVDREVWKKQAVAAIDERTTDCCLRVHGQVQPLNQPFRLTGTPRFADKLQYPPFHWYCRTVVVLVREEDVEDEWTQKMREAAEQMLRRRALLQEQIAEIQSKLQRLGAYPTVRVYPGDSPEVRRLKRELWQLKLELKGEVHPAWAWSSVG